MSAVPPPPPPLPTAVVPPGETKTCPKCAMVIPRAAKFCPHCQKRLGTHPLTIGCAVLFGFFVFLWIVGTMSSSHSKPASAPANLSPEEKQHQAEIDSRRQAEASAAGQKEAEAYLKTPGGKIHAKHPNWERAECDAVAKRQIHIGMTAEQVRAAWGKPEHINSTLTGQREHEQWVYGSQNYVYFENGVMTSLQQTK